MITPKKKNTIRDGGAVALFTLFILFKGLFTAKTALCMPIFIKTDFWSKCIGTLHMAHILK